MLVASGKLGIPNVLTAIAICNPADGEFRHPSVRRLWIKAFQKKGVLLQAMCGKARTCCTPWEILALLFCHPFPYNIGNIPQASAVVGWLKGP